MQTSGRLMAMKLVVSLAITRQKNICSWNIPVFCTLWYGMQRYLTTEKQQILPSKKVLQRIAINSLKVERNHLIKVLKLPTSASAVRNTWQAQNPSIDNDWYIISTDQKDVYAEYTSLFTEAANLLKNEKLNGQESVLGAIKTALQETAKGTFETSNADINKLKATIADANKAIEDITNGISNTSDNLKNAEITSIYSANGTRKAQLTKGINIVKMSNGTVKKILVK